MVGIRVDDITVSRKQAGRGDEFFVQLKQHFPVKNLGELKMYPGFAFESDWNKEILD